MIDIQSIVMDVGGINSFFHVQLVLLIMKYNVVHEIY